MPTSLYLVNTTGTTTAGLSTGDDVRQLSLSRGAGLVASAATPTVAGPTSGLTVKGNNAGSTGKTMVWISSGLSSFTYSTGLNTFNFWMSENSMLANVGPQALLYRWSSGTLTLLLNSEQGVELGTARGVQNWTAGTTAGVAFNTSDRIVIRVAGNDVGTMASGFTFDASWGLGSSGADGDSWLSAPDAISEAGAVIQVPPRNTLSLMGAGV